MAPRRKLRSAHLPPPLVLVGLYGALILIGMLLLKLPIATTRALSWSDIAFTATSAVTVTGLAVADTGRDFTFFGQAVILALIQLGGLGIMSFAVLIMSLVGLPVGYSHRVYLREDLNQTSATDLLKLVRMVLKVVVALELSGAALLALTFVPHLGWAHGLWSSLFHAVSAFNNAGFSLYSDSLSGWVSDPVVNIVLPALLIVGGLGFTVLSDIWRKRRWRGLSLHTKLMLAGTLGLLIFSTLAFAAMEWTNPGTLGPLSPGTKLWASWFQAAATRTAGFNSVDFSATNDSTTLMVMVLMVIGAGSTSTGGGIKVTTFIVLILATIAFFRRHNTIDIFGRRISADQVVKVLALAMVSFFTILMALFVMTLMHEADFLDLAFEVTSAFGTVGLSRGITGDFDTAGRLVIMLIMFIGRVGPLTLGFLLAQRVPKRIAYPEENVLLG